MAQVLAPKKSAVDVASARRAALWQRIVAAVALLVLSVAPLPRPVEANVTAPPVLVSPPPGATVTSFRPALTWTNPPGATQFQIQIIPLSGQGPALDTHIGVRASSGRVPGPPAWDGLLPDQIYTWRVRVSDAPTYVALTDPSWG